MLDAALPTYRQSIIWSQLHHPLFAKQLTACIKQLCQKWEILLK